MIPIRLVLRDFLSYASPDPLDFTGFDVACLSGDNGVGKSALLDAMTWALFAAARGCENGQNQDRLIRDGCTEATVDFTFSLGGATYRIVRHRSRNERGETKGDVRFHVADGDDWKNLAAESLKATDAKIQSVLRMDYDTFTASAFFVQGRSEDFLARMNPTDRKEVFSRLLDLGTYEALEESARARAREADASRRDVAARIGELEASSVDIPAIESEVEQHTARAGQLERETTIATAKVDVAQGVLADIETQQALLDRETLELEETERSLAQAVQHTTAKQTELAEIDEMLTRADVAADAVAELERLRSADEAARTDQAEAAVLARRAAEIVARIDGERRTIDQRVQQSRNRIDVLEKERSALSAAHTELEAIDDELAAATDPAPALADAREQVRAHELAAERLQEQIRILDERIAASAEARVVLGRGGGECPVCGSALDAEHRAEARKRIDADVRTAKSDQQAAKAQVATERKEAKRLTEELRRLEGVALGRTTLAASREGLLARLERLAPVEAEIAALAASAEQDEAAVRSDAFAADLRTELDEVSGRAAARYDEAAHAGVLERLKALEPFAALHGAIQEAGRRRDQVAADVLASAARAQQLEQTAAERRRTITDLTAATSGRAGAQEAVADAQAALTDLQRAAQDVAAVLARLDERLQAARRVSTELEAARGQELSLATEHRRYRRLTEAFGRTGIPNLIIDNAIPELTDEANRILGRLSDYEMSVGFTLQGETKAGKIKETFDIAVHHEGGIRDYAMFSGGEAFRVAFAVRLAMSKLLVRRSGARLETLVIDEGFGTQDPHGRERLVEAINLARQEFAKILVITHLDDLKDQFGAQITVAKGPDGSLLDVTGV